MCSLCLKNVANYRGQAGYVSEYQELFLSWSELNTKSWSIFGDMTTGFRF